MQVPGSSVPAGWVVVSRRRGGCQDLRLASIAHMPWRVRYLANLIMVMNEDGRFSPREALVLSEVRNELRLTLHEMAEAVIQAIGERQPLVHANIITNERNLVDMLAGLLVDGAPQSEAVEVFIDQCAIPTHRLPALLDDARERHAQLRQRMTSRLDQRRP